MDEITGASGRGKNKRFWSKEEDKALIAALHELSIDSHWKCENGFRNGYMLRLEEMIGKSIPNCGLKAIPHIDSRLKTLVSKFRAFLQLLGTSGFKWDDQTHMISVERSVYDEYCKTHPTCKNLYGISFPHLNIMMDIYGKDYATGKRVEGFDDAVENFEKKKHVQVDIDSSDEGETQIIESHPPLKKVKREKVSKKCRSEKVIESSTRSELGCLQDFMKDMNGHLSTMANVWVLAENREQEMVNREKGMSEKRSKVLDELLALDGLSTIEAFEAITILTADQIKLDIFIGCPTALKNSMSKLYLDLMAPKMVGVIVYNMCSRFC